jgi:hypothetical protein
MAKEKKSENGAIFIPACFFLGFGLGFAFNNIPAGMFAGLGLGFFLFAVVKVWKG